MTGDLEQHRLPQHAVVVQHRPAPQGSKRHLGGGRMKEQSDLLPAFRDALDLAMTRHPPPEPFHGPVHVGVAFVLPRPASHYRAGKYAALLGAKAPTWRWAWPAAIGDSDKLLRAVHDALERSRWYANDAQVKAGAYEVTWCERDEPYRVVVEVTQLVPTEQVERVRPRMDTATSATPKARTARPRRPRRRRT